MAFDRPAPDLQKLIVAWEQFEAGEETPGKVLANPKSTKSDKAAAASALSQAPKRRKQLAVGPHNWVLTIIRCGRHRKDCPAICVRVEREVPGPLRCTPGGGSVGGGGGASQSDCPCSGRFDASDLGRRVADALRRGSGGWIRRGAVVIEV